jgi:ApeA-like protein
LALVPVAIGSGDVFDRTIQLLEGPGPVFGEFNLSALPEQESVKGVLSWSVEDGAKLILLEPSEAWGAHELGGQHRVFGLLADNTLITLPEARVSGYRHSAMFEATLRSSRLLLGANVEEDEDAWSKMSFALAHLHGWLPRTGISGPEYEWVEDDRLQRVRIDWSPVEPVEVALEDEAEIRFGFGMQAPSVVSPRRSIDTDLTIGVSVGRPASIDELERRHLRPWLVFSAVVADCWDSPTFQQVSGDEFELPVRVLHEGRTAVARDWEPGGDLYLFSAEDCEDVVAVMTRWLALYERAGLPIAVYAEMLHDGNSYSPGRLIQLVTALEGYCDATGLQGRTLLDKFKALRDKSEVGPPASGCSDGNLDFLWRARNYFTHLGARGGYSPSELEAGLLQSCRWAGVLMQSCLLRELGFSAAEAESLIGKHYRRWPLPR